MTKPLPRAIGPRGAALLVLNGAIGAGIFALPGTLQDAAGSSAAILFPLFALGVFAIALPLAELSRLFEGSGGPAAYVGEAFGRFAGFQAGWIYWAARAAAFAANSVVFTSYAASFVPALGEGAGKTGLLLAIVALMTTLNVVGLRTAFFAQGAVTVLKVAPLVLLAAVALASYGAPAAAFTPPSFSAAEQASLLVLYAFVGFEQALVPAGEMKDPGKTLPRALFATLAVIAGLYFLVQLSYGAVLGGTPKPDAPLVALGETVFGAAGGYLMLAAALFSLAGNLLSIATTAPRITSSFGEAGLLPRWFAAVHPRFETPHHAILFFGALSGLLAVTGGFVFLAVVSTLARLALYLASIAALPIIRKKRGLSAPGAVGLRWTVYAAGSVFCLWAIAHAKPDAFATLAGLAAAGAALYALAARKRS
jgi:amino acid transporter